MLLRLDTGISSHSTLHSRLKERIHSHLHQRPATDLTRSSLTTRHVILRCAGCKYLAICNGNTRVRAQQLTGNPWFEDPGCYLTDDEVGAASTPLEVPAKTKAFNSIRRSKEAENA